MPPDTTPQTVLVTGASRRIGRAIAIDLARLGWRVAIHFGSQAEDADRVKADIEAAGGQAMTFGGDLSLATTPMDLVAAATAGLGPVTCLVNNASLFIEDDLQTLDAATWDRQHAVNLRAPVLLTQAFAAHLPAGMEGNVINIIDQRVLAPTPEFFSYSLAKAGLFAATKMLAQALAPRIRVNGIGPGPVLPSVYQSAETFAAEARGTLLRRPTSPEEIAATVRFILDAPSLTGQMIAIDSGQHLAWRTSDNTTP